MARGLKPTALTALVGTTRIHESTKARKHESTNAREARSLIVPYPPAWFSNMLHVFVFKIVGRTHGL